MWCYLLNALLIAALMLALALRKLVLGALARVRTREPATIKEILFAVHVLQGDAMGIELVTSKNRAAPSGRRGKQRAVRVKIEEEERRRDALATIRKKMGHKLRERVAKNKPKSSYFFW